MTNTIDKLSTVLNDADVSLLQEATESHLRERRRAERADDAHIAAVRHSNMIEFLDLHDLEIPENMLGKVQQIFLEETAIIQDMMGETGQRLVRVLDPNFSVNSQVPAYMIENARKRARAVLEHAVAKANLQQARRYYAVALHHAGEYRTNVTVFCKDGDAALNDQLFYSNLAPVNVHDFEEVVYSPLLDKQDSAAAAQAYLSRPEVAGVELKGVPFLSKRPVSGSRQHTWESVMTHHGLDANTVEPGYVVVGIKNGRKIRGAVMVDIDNLHALSTRKFDLTPEDGDKVVFGTTIYRRHKQAAEVVAQVNGGDSKGVKFASKIGGSR